MKLKDRNLTAEQVKALVSTYMMDTYERFPFVCERAKGMYLYDENGDAYLDFYGGIAVNSVGNCADSVVAAIRDQAGDVIHTFNYPYTLPQALLAEKICTALGMDKIFYQSTGTEANEAMIKLARKYGTDTYGPQKYHIVTAKNSFHGRTYGSMTATGQPDNACQVGYKPMLPGFSYATFNDLDSFRAAVTDDTVAIMVEPIQGEGGVVPATEAFMKGLRALCDEKGLLLLLDEIQTGWCRTGKVMAYMHYGVKPDILSMAKAMGGGMPIGAICATEKVAKAFTPGSHGTTYGGNPVCCAASLAAVTEMLDRALDRNAAEVGEYLMEKLRALPHVAEVRGKGLMIGIVLDAPVGKAVKHGCTDRKLLVTLIGTSVIRLLPPLIATKEDYDRAVAILDAAVSAAY
ncbi:MAG TPA: aspartate aminotransferase family protein [Candidatus Limiplasma sp.]|nr:aspartate aminotransferase family protein [Candidatus Limiplasma sp.]HPS82640.1 aspartate aminotransferase family protein [Candidatus Limiplasma sp.]